MNDRRRKTTREEILKLEPGPELDRLVAERVIGWKEGKDFGVGESGIVRYIREGPKYFERTRIEAWSPSTDIVAAMEVVQKLLEKRLRVSMYSPWGDRNEPHAIPEWTVFVLGNGLGIEVGGETLPLAICRAALLAVMEADNEKKRRNNAL